MKRLFVCLLAFCMLLGAAACKGKEIPAEAGETPQAPLTDAPQETAAQEETEAPAETEEPRAVFDPGSYRLTLYTVGDISFEEERFADIGIEQTSLTLNADHSGVLTLMGQELEITWTEDGQILFYGEPYCTMERADEDTILMTLGDAVLTVSKGEAPEAAEAPAEEPTEAPSDAQTEPGEPYGDSDGIIETAKLSALYRWLNDMQDSFKYELTFDAIGEAAGKQGCDKRNGDGKTHTAYWTNGNNAFITVTFRLKDGKWKCSAISSSGISDDWKTADVSAFPRIGSSAPAGTHPTEVVTHTIKVGSTDTVIAVSAEVPTEQWYPIERSGGVRYYSAPDAEKADESQSYILVESKATIDAINFYLEKFEDLKELKPCTIGGVEMKGRTYRNIGMDWIEYYGELSENVWISVRMTGVDFTEGTETEALVLSLTFAAQ